MIDPKELAAGMRQLLADNPTAVQQFFADALGLDPVVLQKVLTEGVIAKQRRELTDLVAYAENRSAAMLATERESLQKREGQHRNVIASLNAKLSELNNGPVELPTKATVDEMIN
jgi:hypothetical protein